ncbi:MAG: hypothetical protein EOO89_04985 [Pedobacter sp.]|nr:MAG: hypothetical protein EOO89_04985 [Pedobacter sp.]
MSEEVKGKKFGRLYLTLFKQELVKEVELEGSIALVSARHGVSVQALQSWLAEYGSAAYHQGKNRRRSLSEREGIAREIVSGHLSIEEAMLKFNADKRDTVKMWVRDYKQRQEGLTDVFPLEIDPGASCSSSVSSEELKLAELKIRALEVMLDIYFWLVFKPRV